MSQTEQTQGEQEEQPLISHLLELRDCVVKAIIGIAVGLLAIKMGVMAFCGPLFGLPMLAALRAGVYIAPGGEFAFVAFGLARRLGLLSGQESKLLLTATAISMAATPLLNDFGSKVGPAALLT